MKNGRTKNDAADVKTVTIIQWMVDAARGKYWTPMNLVRSINGLWFASSHQVWMTIVNNLHELCKHPEYLPLLREEIGEQSIITPEVVENLPLLDSFMKETSRMNAFDSVAVRRKALKPFTFSDGGPHIPVGNVACVPQAAILLDEMNYPNPMEFDGFRFFTAKPDSAAAVAMPGKERSKFTDVSEKYPVWGYGSWAW
ncbi:hypothetical protein MMC32_001274 [Xylographa parallela]|nr:hypothetical protein [Xylographa parallela]